MPELSFKIFFVEVYHMLLGKKKVLLVLYQLVFIFRCVIVLLIFYFLAIINMVEGNGSSISHK